jgi:hypothetical protein
VKTGSAAERDFSDVYAHIPTKHLKKKSNAKFTGLYIIEQDEDELPIWKITERGVTYVWNAGYDFLPFARFHLPRAQITSAFQELIVWSPVFEHQPYTLERLPHRLTINREFVLFTYTEHSAICVDYFQEEVRMVCARRGKPSHWQIYVKSQKPRGVPLNRNIPQYTKTQDELWKTYSCTEISPEVTLGVLAWARANKYTTASVLDMSAGRGSRLTACIADPHVTRYTGVDPNTLSHQWYETQSRFYCEVFNNTSIFRGRKNPQNFTVLCGGFVETKLPFAYYDIMFSSPPYFDLEEYSSDPQQSVAKNSTISKWLDNFMFASMDKIMAHLRPGGLMCININLSRVYTDDWVSPLIRYDRGCQYLGCISSYKVGKNNVQPIWIWRKHGFETDYIQPVTSVFDHKTVEVECRDIAEVAKYVKLPQITFVTLPLNYKHEYAIYRIADGKMTLCINGIGDLPLGMWHLPRPELKREVSWEIISKPWRTQTQLPETYYKFCGEYIILDILTGELCDLRYFTDPQVLVCHKRDCESPWNLYKSGKTPKLPYAQLMDWFYFNGLLCISSVESHYVALIQFLRQRGYGCRRIYIPENNIFQKTVLAAIVCGCDYLCVDGDCETILNYFQHDIKKWEIRKSQNAEYDMIFYVPTFYEIQKPTDHGDENYIKFKRLDIWIAHIVKLFDEFYDILCPGGIVCFVTYIDYFGDYMSEIFKVSKLKFLGGIATYRNSIMNVWCWQRPHLIKN